MDTESYSEPCKTSEMEYFAIIFRGFYLLTIFTKRSISGVWQGSENAFNCEIIVCQLTACEITVASNCQTVKYWDKTFLQKYCKSLTISISDVLTGFSLLLWNQSEQNPYPSFFNIRMWVCHYIELLVQSNLYKGSFWSGGHLYETISFPQ